MPRLVARPVRGSSVECARITVPAATKAHHYTGMEERRPGASSRIRERAVLQRIFAEDAPHRRPCRAFGSGPCRVEAPCRDSERGPPEDPQEPRIGRSRTARAIVRKLSR